MAQLRRRQSGIATIGSGANNALATVATYVASSSLLVYTVRGGNHEPQSSLVLALKATSGTLTFERNSLSTAVLTIHWELFEFSSDVRIQNVTWTDPGSTGISRVTLARSFIVSAGYKNGGITQSGDDLARFSFASATSASHTIEAGMNVDNGMFQVVDYPGCKVQSFTLTIAANTTSWEQTLVENVVMARTLLFASCFYNGGNAELQFTNVFRVGLTAVDKVQGKRATMGAFTQDVTCFVAMFADWKVQRGNRTQLGGVDTSNVPIQAVTISRSMSKTVAQHGGGHSYCESTATSDLYDESRVTAQLTGVGPTSSNLELKRTNATPTLNIEWEVAEHVGGPDMWHHF